ncbi:hypothetical protein RUND412_006483 [Rhizina undulata]
MEVIVVGAGWFGLIAAKTRVPLIIPEYYLRYLHVNPTHNVTILEASSALGGTWSEPRVYSGLTTHNALGALEISDLPMPKGRTTKEGYITGADVNDYLYLLAETFALKQRIRYNSRVIKIERDSATKEWILTIDENGEVLRCEKLIMAIGLTSAPYTPDVPVENPTVPAFHFLEIKQQEGFLKSEDVKRVTVYGGSKSAFDAVYLCAAAGKHVDWIIRTTGQGVAAMFTAISFGKTSASISPMRILGSLNPCIYNYDSLWSRFLHGTVFGRFIIRKWWRTLTNVTWKKHGLHSSENGKKLIPDLGELGPFWAGSTPTGVISQVDFWDYIHPGKLVTVHRTEIIGITGSSLKLSNGSSLHSDAHIWATGWVRNHTPFATTALARSVGAPIPLSEEPADVAEHWRKLESDADDFVLDKFPILREPPPYNILPRTQTPFRLFRHTIPLAMAARGDHSVAFVGTMHTSGTGMMAEIQALLAVAYLGGRVKLPEEKEMEEGVARAEMWGRRRYLNLGEKCTNITFEFMPVSMASVR